MPPIDIYKPPKSPFEKGDFLYQSVKGWSFFAYVTGELKQCFRVYAIGLEEAAWPPIDIHNPSTPFKFASLLFVAMARQNESICSALSLIATLIRGTFYTNP